MQTLKKLLTIPGVLLLPAIILLNASIGNSALDFHVHDTYYVFSSDSWLGNPFLLFVDGLLLISWGLHGLLTSRQALSKRGRWIHVVITLACLVLFIGFPNWGFPRPRRYLSFQEFDTIYDNYLLYVYSLLALIVTQLLFWIIAFIFLITNHMSKPKRQILS